MKKKGPVMASARIILEDDAMVAERIAIMYIVKEAQQVGKGVNLFLYKLIETAI